MRVSAIRDAWRPQTQQDREAVLAELQQVLASPHFCNSKRYPALLQYVVENTLAGRAEMLKERTLGVEVFDRAPSYDTNADTVVRYTAGEVRKRLSLYYHELGRRPLIQISLPAGSYVPEFLYAEDEAEGLEAHVQEASGHGERGHEGIGRGLDGEHHAVALEFKVRHGVDLEQRMGSAASGVDRARRKRRWLRPVVAVGVLLAMMASVGWRYHAAVVKPVSALDSFWNPVLRDQSVLMLCSGGSVFSTNKYSGVDTAGRDIQYPFVSMQIASGIAQVSSLVGRHDGATTQLESAAVTPLTELRERPVVFLGAYNNQWTLRLVQPLRFHFAPVAEGEAILDSASSSTRWQRDPGMPYSSADDYAVVARFRSSMTDSWVVVLAGIGRNGAEAAAQFATSQHYMELLREKVGGDFASKNIEVVLKANVIDGKTGAPSLVAVHAW